jgi:hypothetical protein
VAVEPPHPIIQVVAVVQVDIAHLLLVQLQVVEHQQKRLQRLLLELTTR